MNLQKPKPAARCEIALGAVGETLKRTGLLLAQGNASSASSAGAKMRLVTDSRQLARGDLFLAYRGVASDGHDHVDQAVRAGASCLVVEDQSAVPSDCSVPWFAVKSGRAAWTQLAAEAFGQPQKGLTLIGVTGTNGKTSTVWMIRQLLRAAGLPSLAIGTLGAFLGDEELPTAHTTPDPDQLYALLAQARDAKITYVAMEVSSHAIEQEKLLPLRYSACGFTSFSRDHLDFHGTMAAYMTAKTRLFTELAAPAATFVLNDGLEPDPRLVGSKSIFVYGSESASRAAFIAPHALPATLMAVSSSFSGTHARIAMPGRRVEGQVPYFARHALENFLCAFLLAESVATRELGPDLWSKLLPVPGRLEPVVGKRQVEVVVDYAHTPDALEKTLKVLRPYCKGKLSVVFGCGGDRDPGKRPEMGRLAEQLADQVYVTSDNPRTEDPPRILDGIRGGLTRPDKARFEVDRAKAIRQAIADARPGDMVLVAGKGHETYQILGTQKIHFDDREVARSALEET